MWEFILSLTGSLFLKMKGHNASILKFLIIYFFLIFISIGLQSIADHYFFFKEVEYLGAPYNDIKGILKSIFYITSYAISIGFVFFVLIQRSTIIWLIFLTYILLSYFIDISSQFIVSRGGFTYFQYVLFLNEAKNCKNLLFFLPDIVKAALTTLIFGTTLIVIRRYIKYRISKRWIFFASLFFAPVLIAKAGIYYITYPAYPPPVKIPIIMANYHLNSKEQPVRILAQDIIAENNQTKNIVLIIDESIRGDFLSINGYNRSTTPDLEELVKNGIITNFGVVNSIGNCSATSQLLLRIGLNPNTESANSDFIATRKSLPTIYQYAKRAGYRTWLIDAQVHQGAMTNYLTYDDMRDIDEYFTNDNRIEDYTRDFVALEKLKSIMKIYDKEKKFIVFVKDGAHWPYLWRYPKNSNLFKPVQSTEYEPRTKENKEKVINTYANLVKYTVNDFLKLYVDVVTAGNVTTYYTSDHGQAFMEESAKDTLTHCSSYYDPPSSQATVPLLVIEHSTIKKYIPDIHKVYSQHQIFPSILMEMGYSEAVRKRYGNTLLDGYQENTERWFYWSIEGNRSLFKNSSEASMHEGAQNN